MAKRTWMLILPCLIMAFSPTLLAAEEPHDESYRDGMIGRIEAYAVYKMGDYEGAFRRFIQMALDGDTAAMEQLATLYERGQGVAAPDPVAADAWRQRAQERPTQ